MKQTNIIIEDRLVNVAPRFQRAIWKLERYDGSIFRSKTDARANGYNLANCNYRIEDENGNVIETVINAKLDGYGRRYN